MKVRLTGWTLRKKSAGNATDLKTLPSVNRCPLSGALSRVVGMKLGMRVEISLCRTIFFKVCRPGVRLQPKAMPLRRPPWISAHGPATWKRPQALVTQDCGVIVHSLRAGRHNRC